MNCEFGKNYIIGGKSLEVCYDEISKLYNELIHAVCKKYPNESRHETALRYIKQAENEAFVRESQVMEAN
jgi:hypothetical protein